MYLAGKIILSLYLYLISYFYTLSVPLSWTTPIRLLGIYGVVHFVCKGLEKVHIQVLEQARKKNWKFGAAVFGLVFFILGIYYLAYYPGGLIIDTFNQWYQVQKGYLSDWHPAIHTILFLKLPSLLCNSLAFVNFAQMVWLSLACAYLGMVLESWGMKKRWCFLMIGLSVFHPASAITMSFCWKDTALTLFMILLAGQIAEIIFSNGEWLKKWYHPMLFGLTGALAALMRHNAILLVGPLMLLVAILYWKELRRTCIAAGVWTLLFMAVIKGPVYILLQVQSHPQVSAEMLGVPMTILANVLVNEPELLDEEAREFLYRIGDQELWETTYREGSWNSAKWMGDDISNDVIEEVGTKNVLRYTWNAIKKAPYYAYRAVVKLFEVVWKPAGTNVEWSYYVNVGSNIFDYEMKGIPILQNLLDGIRQFSIEGTPLTTWGWYIGFFILLLLFMGITCLKEGWKKCLCWVPILCYNFGTALLLCGWDFRFFSFNTVITLPLLLVMLSKKEEVSFVEE